MTPLEFFHRLKQRYEVIPTSANVSYISISISIYKIYIYIYKLYYVLYI